MAEQGWVTLKDGRRILINNYMNDFIRNKGQKDYFRMYENNKKIFEKLFEKDATSSRTEFYKKLGLNGKPKVMSENEFNKIKDKNNPIMQRSTSEKGYEDLINGNYRISDLTNSMYGSGIYFSYDENDNSYYAGLANTSKVFQARMDKSSNMINNKELDDIKGEIRKKIGNDAKRIDSIILADNGVLAASLGYDGIYFDNVKYALVFNSKKIIIKESKEDKK